MLKINTPVPLDEAAPLGEADAIQALSALAQPTRLGVFRLLVGRFPGTVLAGEIANSLGVPHNTMSAHLGILNRAGLVTVQRRGRTMHYRADMAGFSALMSFLAKDCCSGQPELCDVVPLAPGGDGCRNK
ncbi:MAG: metalloregulator ArsR/SmtB family transcription factor [Zavarzinia sp.]|nr:metalloregulator ArsR/SmtB family transcription factor [Zavarzinia sp.]